MSAASWVQVQSTFEPQGPVMDAVPSRVTVSPRGLRSRSGPASARVLNSRENRTPP